MKNILHRPYLTPERNLIKIELHVCECKDKRRGKEGQCCGNCGGAIPTKDELNNLK